MVAGFFARCFSVPDATAIMPQARPARAGISPAPNRMSRIAPALTLVLITLAAWCIAAAADDGAPADAPALRALGQALFFDTNLSRRRTQACASCHDPARAFTDGRADLSGAVAAASLGDDGHSRGTRNAPTLSYATLTPGFTRAADGEYVGGLFHDGRAADLLVQAQEPFLNPREMALSDAATVVARVRENPAHERALTSLFGPAVFADTTRAFAAIARAIIAFEQSDLFAPFDSRYDRYLRGEYTLTEEEDLGRRFFFSDLVNCASCHLMHSMAPSAREPFTNHRYHNVGVPANRALTAGGSVDRGLADNPAVADPAQAGKFKVPTLRNVAVTAPYMHNGVFRELFTAIHFYNRHIVDSAYSRTNPETGRTWDPPEVRANQAHALLRAGQPLDEDRIAALIAFLRTLTDRRYEHLLEPQ